MGSFLSESAEIGTMRDQNSAYLQIRCKILFLLLFPACVNLTDFHCTVVRRKLLLTLISQLCKLQLWVLSEAETKQTTWVGLFIFSPALACVRCPEKEVFFDTMNNPVVMLCHHSIKKSKEILGAPWHFPSQKL